MSSGAIRIAAIGCGRVAQHYRRILDSGVVSGWSMVGFADLVVERAQELGAHFDAPSFGDHNEMLDECRPDLVLVLTPSGCHYEHARDVLERGVHVLVEKPLAMRAAEAIELAALADAQRVMCAVAFQNRLNPAVVCLHRALAEGRFGKLVTATIRLRWCRLQSYYEDGWHGTWSQDGGVINQQAIHHVDALNWLVGPVRSVCAVATNRLNRLEAEDTMVAALRFESGAVGTIEATTAARPQDYEASISIVGEKGIAVIGGIALNKVEVWSFVEPKPSDVEAPRMHSQNVPNGYGLSHGPLLQQIVSALASGSNLPPVSAQDAIPTTRLVHALYRSHEAGSWVSPADDVESQLLGQPARSL